MNVIELRQMRASAVSQAREIIDQAEAEGRELNQEEQIRWDAFMVDVDELKGKIDKLEALEKAETETRGHRPEVETTTARAEGLTEERFNRWLTDGFKGWSGREQEEIRALQADADIYGGYLYPGQQFVNTLIKDLDNLVFLRGMATVYTVNDAETLGAPSLDNDPADPAWTTELAIGSEDSTMSFGKRELKPNPLAKYIKVSRKLLRKVGNAEALVRSRLAYKFAVVEENAFLNGIGVGNPLGVFTASANGISTGRDVSTGNTTTAMTFDGLKEVKYTLKGQYWPRARWIFHRSGVKQIAKLKDGDGQYIWAESVRVGEPDRLLGFPVMMSEYAPSTFTTGLYVGILGDFSYYWIADSLSMEMQRLDELYAATNQVGFIGRLETDGMPVLENAFVRVKLA